MAATVNVGVLEAVLRLKDVMSPALNNAGKQLTRWGARAGRVGGSLTRGLSLPLLAIGAAAVKAAVDFESSFAGVRKTVDATEAQFAVLKQGFRDLAQEIPVSVNALNGIGEAAGQLGIKTENILDFTETMAALGVTTNLAAEEAATSLARLANITGMSQGDFDRLGSTVVGLGNNFATTEAEIVAFGLRIAGAGAQIGLTEGEILGLGTALSSVGINAEAGGTAISKVMIQIASAVASGGAELDQFAAIAARTGTIARGDFAEAFRDDAAGAIVTFIEGLGTLDDAGINTFAVLEDLGMQEVRVRDAMLRASGAGDLLRESVELGNDAWRENTALTAEAAVRFATTESRLKLLSQKVYDLRISLGEALLPVFESVMGVAERLLPSAKRLIDRFAALPGPVRDTATATLLLVAALGPLLMVFGSISTGVGTLLPVLGVFSAAVRSLGGKHLVTLGARLVRIGRSAAGLRGVVTVLARGFVGLSNPIGWVVTALTLLGAVSENFRRIAVAVGRIIKGVVVNAFQDLVASIKSAWQWVTNLASTVSGTLAPIWEFFEGVLGVVADGFEDVADAVGGVEEAVDDAVAPTEALADEVETLGDGLDALPGVVDPVVTGLGDLGGAAGVARDEVQQLADRLSDAGLAGDITTLEAAWSSLDPEMQRNAHTLQRVSAEALAIIDRGGSLTGTVAALGMAAFVAREQGLVPLADGLDAVTIQLGDQEAALDRLGSEMIWATQHGYGPMIASVDMFRDGIVQLEQPIADFHQALGQTPGFFDNIRTSLGGFVQGLTGGEGLSGFFTQFGAGVVSGLGEILSGGITSLIAVGTQLAIQGLTALGKKLFEGFGHIWNTVRGLFGRTAEDNIRITGERLGFAIGEGLQTTIAQTAEAIGHDYTAFLLHLGAITDAQGGVMVAGFQTVARTGRDLFSMVQEGRITTEQAMGALGPVLEELGANFDQAGDKGQLQFIELIQVAASMGVSLETLRGLVGTLADDALATQLDRAIIDANGNIHGLADAIRAVPRSIPIRAHLDVDTSRFRAGVRDAIGQMPDVPGLQVPGFQGGTGGRFVDFGAGLGSLVRLHGREAIVPEGQAGPGSDALAREIHALRSELQTDRAFQAQLVPKMLAAAMAQQGVAR